MAQSYTYVPSRTGQAFHEAPLGSYLYKGIRGVPGSGKSVDCCWDMRLLSEKQPAFWDAKSERMVRWSRWGVFRKTFPALKGTTIKTWMDWFAPFTTLHESPPLEGLFEAPSLHQDGSWVRIELKFLATDSPNFFDDLDSLELSGAYVNEAAQIELEKIHKIQERVGRFKPPGAAAAGLKFLAFGVIMDTNTPLETSWWYRLEQVERPKRMLFFIQPPALIRTKDEFGNVKYVRNDEENSKRYGTSGPCENVEHHNEGWDYYEKQLIGADEDYIKRRLLNQYGRSKGGLPVYSEYLDELHCTSEDMEISRGENTLVGMDFGRNPAAVLSKLSPMGQLRVHRECVEFNMGVPRFVDEHLIPLLVNEFDWPNTPAIIFGDPAGENPGEMSDIGPIPYLNSRGIMCVVPEVLRGRNNSVDLRLNAVSELLRSNYKGVPDLLVSSKCEYLRNGFNGDYHYKQMRTMEGSTPKYTDSPEKNEFSHVHDALQYLACGIRGGGSRFARGPLSANSAPAFERSRSRSRARCV